MFNFKATIMAKKINKIKIIDAPKESILTDNDLLEFLGGDNCTSYTQCSAEGKSLCDVWDSGQCSGTVGANLKCSKYVH